TLGSMVQKGKFLASAFAVADTALNSVLLPTFGSPTIPTLTPTSALLRRHWSFGDDGEYHAPALGCTLAGPLDHLGCLPFLRSRPSPSCWPSGWPPRWSMPRTVLPSTVPPRSLR